MSVSSNFTKKSPSSQCRALSNTATLCIIVLTFLALMTTFVMKYETAYAHEKKSFSAVDDKNIRRNLKAPSLQAPSFDPPYNFRDIAQKNNLTRPFQVNYPYIYSWCDLNDSDDPETGLIYVKTPKTGSSTAAGIARRISHTVAARTGRHQKHATSKTCWHTTEHMKDRGSIGMSFGRRHKKKSFMFTTLRNPAKRGISRIFFQKVTKQGLYPSDANVRYWLDDTSPQVGTVSPGMGGFQLAYISLDPPKEWYAWNHTFPDEVRDHEAVHEHVRGILDAYDFIILLERFDESIVVMMLLLDLKYTDILYLSAKQAGNYWYNVRKNKCDLIASSYTSPAITEYLSSKEWYAKSYGDYLLIEAANQSLDLTIEKLGRKRFNDALQKFKELKVLAEERCGEEAIFPCTADGVPQKELAITSCYNDDEGCGYPCIDKLTEELHFT